MNPKKADVNEADNADKPKNRQHQDEAKIAKTANNPTTADAEGCDEAKRHDVIKGQV